MFLTNTIGVQGTSKGVLFLMGSIRKSSKQIKLDLESSLFALIKEKKYHEISIDDLCKKANVGRTSFYRHFYDKDDVILFAYVRMWEDWCESHNVKERSKFDIENAETFFAYNYSIRDRLDITYRNNLGHIILKSFELLMTDDNEHNYESMFYGYGLFGILKEWWNRGFKESSNEVAKILRQMYQ